MPLITGVPMVFSSTVFLFIFLPAVWLIYSAIPRKYLKVKNLILAIASLIFYAYGEPVYVLIMIGSVTFNYFAARLISRYRKADRLITVVAVAANLSLLFLFKYVPWLTTVVNDAAGISLPVPSLTIPVGISFYTFQILSYVIDVKRGKCEPQKNYVKLFLYISFFPQLIAGPIVKYGDIAEQLSSRDITLDKTSAGIRRFITGLSKKVLISNAAAYVADAAFGAATLSSPTAWAGAICYCLQLYYDFSGSSDMAIGLASMFGFRIGENFNYPYAATSIRDFWKRWHISLTSWFREYLYFPLGGNRKGKVRTVVNRIIVFFLTGAWHGANFTYIVWGLWHGFLMLFEEFAGISRIEKKRAARPLTRIYTLLAVCIGFVVFRAPGVSSAISYIVAMFSFRGSLDIAVFLTPWNIVMVLFGVLFSFPLIKYIKKHTSRLGENFQGVISYAASALLLALSIMSLVSSEFNPFIYYIF